MNINNKVSSKKGNKLKLLFRLLLVVIMIIFLYKLFFTKNNYDEIVEITRDVVYKEQNNTTPVAKIQDNKSTQNNSKTNAITNNKTKTDTKAVEMLDILIPIQ